ncbi:uncharacterized protein [Eucyclogobius newberryi]|uniref:uncharacterized protein n=1 Tax=Eucyclogobius newberryi TaxID=166745 RepID=UPI003B5B664B
MSAFAYYVNSILQHGGTKKAAFTRLCKLGITTTYANAVGKQKEFAARCGEALQTLKVENELFLHSQTERDNMALGSVHKSMEDLMLSDERDDITALGMEKFPFSFLPCWETSNTTSSLSLSQCSLPPTYTIVFDNLDFYMKAHHQSVAHSDKSLHWIHHIAVEDRIQINHLPNARPKVDISTYDLGRSLPGSKVQEHIRREFIVLGSGLLTQYLHAFKPLANVVVNHMPHQYSEEMSHRSTDYPLGLLFKYENKTGEPVDVLQHLQKEYVPKGPTGVSSVLVGGDRLTEANCKNIQSAFADGATEEDLLEGLAFKFEDWHAVRYLMEIHYKIFFRQDSARDHGTVYANMNVLSTHLRQHELSRCFMN